MKKLIALILLLALFAASVFGCKSEMPKEDKTPESSEDKTPEGSEDKTPEGSEEKIYESIDFTPKGYVRNPLNLKYPDKANVFIIESVDELSAFDPDNVLNLKDNYTSDFFETKVLFFFMFDHRSSAEFIEFSAIIEKDGKLYPVMTGYENCDPGALGTDDGQGDLHYAEISRDDIADTGELLVINTYGEGYGIMDYKPLDGKLVKEGN